MGVFFSLFGHALDCVLYGFLIAIFVAVTLYFLLSTVSKGAVCTIPFWISITITTIALWVNMTVMTGAIKVKQATTAMEMWLNQLLDNIDGVANVAGSQEIGDALDSHFPILSSYVNLFNFSGHNYRELPVVIAQTINDEMNSQILSNVLWSLGFILAATLVSLYFDRGNVAVRGRSNRRAGMESRVRRRVPTRPGRRIARR